MSPKTARLETRLTHRNHSLIQHAAGLRGQSVTDFVVAAALAEAQRAIADDSLIALSLQEQKQFADALLSPKMPSAALKRAAKAHRKLIGPS